MKIDKKKLVKEIWQHESDANLNRIAEQGIKEYLKRRNITYISEEYIWAVQSVIPKLTKEIDISFIKLIAISSIINFIVYRCKVRRHFGKKNNKKIRRINNEKRSKIL